MEIYRSWNVVFIDQTKDGWQTNSHGKKKQELCKIF